MQNVIIDCNKSTIKNSVLSLVILQNIFTYTRGISEFLIKFSTWTGHQILIENDKFNLAEKILQDPLISWLSQIEIILADSNQLWKLLINFLISAGWQSQIWEVKGGSWIVAWKTKGEWKFNFDSENVQLLACTRVFVTKNATILVINSLLGAWWC